MTNDSLTKNVLVIGASEKPERYSNIAITMLQEYEHKVYAIGNKEGIVNGVEIAKEKLPFQNVDTITLYLSEKFQSEYYNYIISLKPIRIIFNPGTENEELFNLAIQNNIQALNACTLVLLKTHQF